MNVNRHKCYCLKCKRVGHHDGYCMRCTDSPTCYKTHWHEDIPPAVVIILMTIIFVAWFALVFL